MQRSCETSGTSSGVRDAIFPKGLQQITSREDCVLVWSYENGFRERIYPLPVMIHRQPAMIAGPLDRRPLLAVLHDHAHQPARDVSHGPLCRR